MFIKKLLPDTVDGQQMPLMHVLPAVEQVPAEQSPVVTPLLGHT